MGADQGAEAVGVGEGATGEVVEPAEIDARALHGRAVAVVSQAIDAGDVDVALRVLALGDPKAARRRRRWTGVALVGVAAVSLLAGVVLGGVVNGGTAGENAPEPLAFGDVSASTESAAAGTPATDVPVDPAATEAAAVDPGVTVPAEVLGTSITAAPSTGTGSTTGSTGTGTGTGTGAARTTATTAAPRAPGAAAAPTAPTPTVAAAPTTAAPRVGALDGNWVAGASTAGYRISKTWTLGGNTEEVVGRTNRVGGGLTIAADRLTAANVVVDMNFIDSGNLIRDAAFKEQLLLTAGYPEARFDLSAPIDISGRPAAGGVFTARASGKLKVRGVVRDVVADLQARQNGAAVQVIGSIVVKLADFGVPNPTFALATVSDQAKIEFSVTFTKG